MDSTSLPPPAFDSPEAGSRRRQTRIERLDRLMEVGMAIAETAGEMTLRAARAEAEAPAPKPEPRPRPAPAASLGMPGMPSLPMPDLPLPGAPRPQTDRPWSPRLGRPDWGILFTRVSAEIRALAALATRIDEGTLDSKRGPGRCYIDPRKQRLRKLLREAVEADPQGRDLGVRMNEIEDRIDQDDVKQAINRGDPIAWLLDLACSDLDIDYDYSRLTDDELGLGRHRADKAAREAAKEAKGTGPPEEAAD